LKYCEIIADNLSKGRMELGLCCNCGREGRTIWIVDAHGYGNRFVVRANEMTAFLHLQAAIQDCAKLS
jgi:hypothetical protein